MIESYTLTFAGVAAIVLPAAATYFFRKKSQADEKLLKDLEELKKDLVSLNIRVSVEESHMGNVREDIQEIKNAITKVADLMNKRFCDK